MLNLTIHVVVFDAEIALRWPGGAVIKFKNKTKKIKEKRKQKRN